MTSQFNFSIDGYNHFFPTTFDGPRIRIDHTTQCLMKSRKIYEVIRFICPEPSRCILLTPRENVAEVRNRITEIYSKRAADSVLKPKMYEGSPAKIKANGRIAIPQFMIDFIGSTPHGGEVTVFVKKWMEIYPREIGMQLIA